MSFQKHNNEQSGFTLIELMITIAILAIIASIAAPSFRPAITQKHAEFAMQSLYQAVKLARSTAISTSRNTYVCRTVYENSSEGTAKCGAGGNVGWASGLLVYSLPPRQTNRASKLYNSAQDQLIKTIQILNLKSHANIDFNGGTRWGGAAPIGFNSQGELLYPGNGNFVFTYCQKDKNAEKPQYLYISPSGKISREQDTNLSKKCT